jgi:HSP20 family molecular chaperone IbpA
MFERSIRLPEFVDGEHTGASFTNGLLTLTVPRLRAAQPRDIEIRTEKQHPVEISNGIENGSAKASSN